MKKVMIFLNAYSQGMSGADKICIETWKHLDNGHIVVMTSRQGKKVCTNFDLKANFIITTSESTFRNPFQTYLKRIIVGMWKAIVSPKQDILYSSSDQLPDIFPAVIMKIRNPNAHWIARSYHMIPPERFTSYFAQKLSFFILRAFSATLITASSHMRSKLMLSGFSKQNIHVIHPGISQKRIVPNKTGKHFDAIFLSRLHPSKGIFDLVEIWKCVSKSLPSTKLAIIGTGDTAVIEKLNFIMKQHNQTKSISLLGHLSDLEATQIISNSTVFIFPSHEEGFSLTMAEVLLLGIPIVAYDLPAYQDIFPYALTLSPRFDINTFADQVVNICNNPKKYKKNIDHGKNIAQKFTWERAIEKERKIMRL